MASESGDTIDALLGEAEAKDKRIAELEARLDGVGVHDGETLLSSAQRMLDRLAELESACIRKNEDGMAAHRCTLAQAKRIAELESALEAAIQWHHKFGDGHMDTDEELMETMEAALKGKDGQGD